MDGTNFTAPYQLDEDYDYDPNGNRLSVDYTDNNAVELGAYWRLDEAGGTTTADGSGNGLTATLGGTPAWITTGLVSQIVNNLSALHFDSNGDYLDISNSTPLQVGLEDFSASAWVKFDPGFNQDMMIFAHGNPTSENGNGIEFVYRGSVTTKPLTLRINDGTPSGKSQQVTYLTQYGLEDGQWHHLGFTIDRDGQIVLYVDGLAVRAATSVKQGNINPTTPFYVGRATAGPTSSNLRGKIDELRVYHDAISPADMVNQYQARDNGYTVLSEIGENNQLLSDDTQSFMYDEEGNRSQRTQTVGMAVDTYKWDHRNRLTSISRSGPRESVQFDFESDNGALIVDYLGNAWNGFLENGASVVGTIAHGGHTMAVMLDGSNDFGNLGIQDWFAPSADGFTLSTWFYPQYKQSEMGLISFGGVYSSEVGYSLTMSGSSSQSSPSQLNFTINDGVGAGQTVSYLHNDSLLSGWHHVAVTIDGVTAGTREVKLYLDGVVAKTAVLSETVPFGTVLQPFVIGAKASGSQAHFKGQLDDVRTVPYALSATHFPWMMANPYPATENTMQVDYTYDHQNRLISRTADPDGSAGPAAVTTEFFVHDGVPSAASSSGEMAGTIDALTRRLANPDAAMVPSDLAEIGQIVLRLDPSGQVLGRYLWSDQVDHLLAQEAPPISPSGPQSAGLAIWPMTDHLGTVRDLVQYNAQSGAVESILHRAYDSYGNVTAITLSDPSLDTLFSFTGRFYDAITGLQNNLNRWYDAIVGRWVNEDLISFALGDANLNRYVTNTPTNVLDPNGLCGSATISAIVNLVSQYLDATASLPFVFPLSPNNPHQHCVWNCRMTRAFGPDFAERMSDEKEEIDVAYAQLGNSLSDDCWNALPSSARRWIAGNACSANQQSDSSDNAAGRECGMCADNGSCEDCCTKSKGIGPNTPEGNQQGSTRPYGPLCNDRFRSEL